LFCLLVSDLLIVHSDRTTAAFGMEELEAIAAVVAALAFNTST